MIDAAFDRLLKYKKWNAEQKEALHFVRNSQGGMVLIMGSAGTNKTLLQEALTKFFAKLALMSSASPLLTPMSTTSRITCLQSFQKSL